MKSGKRLLSALLVLVLLLLPAAMAEQDAAEAFFLTPEESAEESLSLESEAESAEESLPLETEEESAEESFPLETEEAAPSDASLVEAHTLTISDPRVTVGGVDLLNLEGLRVEGTFAGDDDSADVLLRLLGGDDVAAEGYASFDGRSIVFGADGLSSDYALPLEKMAGGMNGFSPAVGMAAELLSENALLELVDSYLGAVETFVEDMLSSRAELGAQTIDFVTGPMEMQGFRYTVTSEDMVDYMEACLDALASIPTLAELIQRGTGLMGARQAPEPDAYNAEKDAPQQTEAASMPGMGSALAEMGDLTATYWYAGDEKAPDALRIVLEYGRDGEYRCVGDVYLLEDGNYALSMDMEQAFGGTPMTMHMEGVASPSGTLPPILAGETQAVMDQLAGLYTDLLGDMMDVTFTMEMRDTLTAEGDFYIYPQGYNESSADRSAFGMHMNVVNADGEGGFANIEGYYSPADGVYYDYDEFALTVNFGTPADDQTYDVLVQTQHADGHEYYGAQLSASSPIRGAQSAYFTYEGDYAPNALGTEDNEGRLSLGASVGYGGMSVDYTASANVSMTHAMMDASALPAGKGAPVDLFMLDEKGQQQLSLEGGIIGIQIVGILSKNVPGVISLISGMQFF